MGSRKSNDYRGANPGPGAYNPRIDCSREQIGGVTIGTSARDSRAMGGGSRD